LFKGGLSCCSVVCCIFPEFQGKVWIIFQIDHGGEKLIGNSVDTHGVNDGIMLRGFATKERKPHVLQSAR
jgi:hypothetical protein